MSDRTALMFRRTARSFAAVLVFLSAFVCTVRAAAQTTNAHPLPKPNPGAIVEQPQLQGMPLERTRRNAELRVAGGIAALVCPAQRGACESNPGISLALTGLHRPEGFFAWGGSLTAFTLQQTWRQAAGAVALTHRAVAGRLLAQLHPLSDHWVDPYFGLGLGVGAFSSRAVFDAMEDVDGSRGVDGAPSVTSWSPFYAARFGVQLELSERLRVGAVADWSNVQTLTGRNCPWKALGMCSSGDWGAFSTDNSIWKFGAELSFAFGEEL